MRRILVLQLRKLGDMLQTTPLLRQLRRLHPEAELDVLCEPTTEAVVRHNPHVADRLLLPRHPTAVQILATFAEVRRRRYDLAVDGQSLPITAILARMTNAPMRAGFYRRWICNGLCYTHPTHEAVDRADYCALTKLRLPGDPRTDESDLTLDLPLSPAQRENAERFVRAFIRPPTAALFPGCEYADRRWPPEKFAQVGDRLARMGFQVWLIRHPVEIALARQVAAAMRRPPLVDYPPLEFAEVKGVLERCAVYVGNDSAPKHAALAAGIPTVGLFDRHAPERWTPPGDPRHRFVATRPSRRALPTHGPCTNAPTLADIAVDEVWQAIQSLIGEGHVRAP
jgi:ADP-heptose:LPS heptosyltransferase